MNTANIPTPRIGISDDALTRPDWTAQGARADNAIWLDRNENIDPVLARVTKSILSELEANALYAYPDLGDLYQKLAMVLGGRAEQYVLAAGSDGAIRSVFEAYISPGDVVIYSSPTFAMYSVYSRMYAADARACRYVSSADGLVLDIDDLLNNIKILKPRLVCLPNPDSPTGSVVCEADLKRLVKATQSIGAVMLVDEAYYPFYAHTVMSWVDEYPHLVVTRSFGKAWGMAGVRVGVAIAHPDMARILHKVRPMYEIGTLSACVLNKMLDHAQDVSDSVSRVLDAKRWFVSEMEAMGYQVLQTHGNFVHVAFGHDAQAVHEALEGRVLYRRDFPNSTLSGYSRFSVAPRAIMQSVVEMIRTRN